MATDYAALMNKLNYDQSQLTYQTALKRSRTPPPMYKAPTWSGSSTVAPVPTYNAPDIGNAPTFGGASIDPAPAYNAPTLQNMPEYNAPVWNDAAVGDLTQQRAAAGVRTLRDQIQMATNRRYGSPQVARMTLRSALQGYGAGLDTVMSGAATTATNEYTQKLGIATDAAKTKWQGQAQNVQMANTALQENAARTLSSDLSTWGTKASLAQDTAKTNYQGGMTAWEARTQAASDAAKANYTGQMAGWQANTANTQADKTAQRAAELDASRINFNALYDRWRNG